MIQSSFFLDKSFANMLCSLRCAMIDCFIKVRLFFICVSYRTKEGGILTDDDDIKSQDRSSISRGRI